MPRMLVSTNADAIADLLNYWLDQTDEQDHVDTEWYVEQDNDWKTEKMMGGE